MATKTNSRINGQDYYRIRRVIGHRIDENGQKKPVYKNFYGSSKTNAENLYKDYVKEQARIRYEGELIMDTATLHFRAKDYIDNVLKVSTKYAAGTKKRYQSAYENYVSGTWIDKMAARDIKATDIQRFYNDLAVTKPTIKAINKFMSAFYKWMVLNGYANDVLTAVTIPEKKENKRREDDTIQVWTDKEWKYLTAYESPDFDFRGEFLIKLMCYSGMRISECLALKYGDIDDNNISVTRQYYMGEIKPPKYNSKRDIPVHPSISAALEKHKAWHEQEMQDNGYQTDYIFTTRYGTLYDVRDLRRAFNRFYDRSHLPHKGFHTYRSTFCTKLCEAKVPIEVASEMLGHKSLEVTAKHYALIRDKTKQKAIAKLK